MDWKRVLESLKFAVIFMVVIGALIGGVFMIAWGMAQLLRFAVIGGVILFTLGIAAVHYVS